MAPTLTAIKEDFEARLPEGCTLSPSLLHGFNISRNSEPDVSILQYGQELYVSSLNHEYNTNNSKCHYLLPYHTQFNLADADAIEQIETHLAKLGIKLKTNSEEAERN